MNGKGCIVVPRGELKELGLPCPGRGLNINAVLDRLGGETRLMPGDLCEGVYDLCYHGRRGCNLHIVGDREEDPPSI